MRAHRSLALLAASCLLASVAAAHAASAVDTTDEQIVPRDHMRDVVDVRDVRTENGNVTGIVVNRSDHPLRDVQLQVKHAWLWDNEFHPGTDGPGSVDYVTVPGEIPPGGQARFTAAAPAGGEARSGGHFMTTVSVSSVTEMSRPSMAGEAAPGTYAAPARPSAAAPGGEIDVPENATR